MGGGGMTKALVPMGDVQWADSWLSWHFLPRDITIGSFVRISELDPECVAIAHSDLRADLVRLAQSGDRVLAKEKNLAMQGRPELHRPPTVGVRAIARKSFIASCYNPNTNQGD